MQSQVYFRLLRPYVCTCNSIEKTLRRNNFSLFNNRLCHLKNLFTSVSSSITFRQIQTTNICRRAFCKLTREYYKENRLVAPIFLYAESYVEKTAIIDRNGNHLYQDLIHRGSQLALELERLVCVTKYPTKRLNGARVAILCPNDVSYVVAQWGTWIAEGVSVPLGPDHSESDLLYRVKDSSASVVIAHESLADKVRPLTEKLKISLKVLKPTEYTCLAEEKFSFWGSLKGRPYGIQKKNYIKKLYAGHYAHKPALIIYTSGTTADPKGVVLTHGNLQSQMESMVKSWQWSSRDTVLHVLPLYHVHGVVNVLMTSLYCGATCVMHQRFDPKSVWDELTRQNQSDGYGVNLLMAVPTVYAKLINYYQTHMEKKYGSFSKSYLQSLLHTNIRLMVSGSDALPRATMKKWLDLTGHFLLERYGMTETGMVLTNKLRTVLHGSDAERQKLEGCVGNPFPGVEVRIIKPNVYSELNYDVLCEGNSIRTHVFEEADRVQGELYVKGPSVFKDYWQKPKQTSEAFTIDGWFKTGDFAEYDGENYKILGRISVDIIKNGGYKVSALHIERHVCQHPAIDQVAVVGVPHPVWGQSVLAVVVLRPDKTLTLKELQDFCQDALTKYEKPTYLKVVDSLPRNHMGKVSKKQLSDSLTEFKSVM